MKRYFLSVCAALFALMVLCSVTTRAADNVYAILYDDGTLVFQHGDTPEPGKTVTKTYEVDLNAGYDKDGLTNTPWYKERKSIRVVNFKDKISPTSTACWFGECENLERIDNIQNLDTSNVTDMTGMFWRCSGLTVLDVSHFDTANVTDMAAMFRDCRGLTALDISHFDTANVTDMEWMFSGCILTALDVSHFDTSKVKNMKRMFYGCSGLTALDVSHFDTANVTDMELMFCGCISLTALDVSHFDTTNVTNMNAMFSGCSELTALDVSHFDTTNVTSMYHMFNGCSGLTALDCSRFDTANVTSMYGMFWDCSGLTTLDLSHFDTANVTSMWSMFNGCSKLKTIYVSDKFTTASVKAKSYDAANVFTSCTSLVGGNGTKYDESYTDKEYARIDTPSEPGYFTSKTQTEPTPETYVLTAYAGEGGTVTPAGDTRISAGGSQKYVMTPNPGYRVQSVRIDGVEVGALSEYVFQNVVTGHNLVAAFEKLPRYAITAAVGNGDELSVTLENSGSVTVAVWYSDRNGKFLSADMQTVSANAGTVTFPLPFAYRARVTLFDSRYCPLCDPVTVR